MSGAPIPSLKLNLDIKRQVLCSKLKIEQQIWIRIINCSTYTFARPSGVASGPSASSSVLWFGHFTNCRFFRRTLNRKRDHGAEKERCCVDGRVTDGSGAREKTTANAKSLQLHFPPIGAFAASMRRSMGLLAYHLQQMRHNMGCVHRRGNLNAHA